MADVPKFLHITNIQRSSFHDGPGIRTTVFFKGCGLNCLWCQNPESIIFDDINGKSKTEISTLINTILKDKKYYDASGGGVTFSGGEPFMQNTDALKKVLAILKSKGLHVSFETALHAPWEKIEPLLPFIDLIYVDFKTIGDEELHKRLTGSSQRLILNNFDNLMKHKSKILIRMAIIPNHNDSENHLVQVAEFLKLKGFNTIELMKYHNMYEDKAKKLNIKIPLLKIPQAESKLAVENAIEIFAQNGIEGYTVDKMQSDYTVKISPRLLKIQQDHEMHKEPFA